VLGIRLSRNFGHQNALVAGMTSLYNKFDVYISIDADLQDDIGMIPQMVNYYHADFRLIDNQVLGEFLNFGESNLYLRGIFPGIGFNQSSVYYSRKERKAGEPKYTWGKSMALAWQGTISGQAPFYFQYLIECGTEFMPPSATFKQIVQDHLQSAYYPLERVHTTGLTGNITDAETSEALSATVKILEIYDPMIEPRTSDELFGRYHRLMLPGTYTVEVSKENYVTQVIEDVEIDDQELVELDVALNMVVGISETEKYISDIKLSPNPLSSNGTIGFFLKRESQVVIDIYDVVGNRVSTIINERLDKGQQHIDINTSDISNGLYFYTIELDNSKFTAKLLVRH